MYKSHQLAATKEWQASGRVATSKPLDGLCVPEFLAVCQVSAFSVKRGVVLGRRET
jgi:hypothetical protein